MCFSQVIYTSFIRTSFETFITTPSNRQARTAAEKVCRFPGGVSRNPLVLYGKYGTGKTHLLHAMATSFLEKGLSVICVSAHQLVKDLVESIRSGDEKPFEETYQKADVVLIDDLHELAHKDTTQEFVWHLVENLIFKEKQVVIALNDSYCENSTLRPSLREVLSRGLCVELNTPDLESRTLLVEQALINQGICWPKEACRYVALKCGASISQIAGEINAILACKSLL